jgi:ABC-type nitrate/sulfonate/bicarbonate transport system substrate-binding protein
MTLLRTLAGIAAGTALGLNLLAAQAQEPPREIRIGLASTSFATAPARVAAELGLFEAHGLAPSFVVLDSASAATTAMMSGSVDAAVSGPGEVIAAQARGQEVVAIASIYKALSGTLVLEKSVADGLGVAPDAPVADRLKALDGLTIAGPSATAAYTLAFKSATEEAGVDDLGFVYMGQPAMLAALDSGAIQGFIGGAPFWALPVIKGNGVVWISGPKGELPAESMPGASANVQVMRAFAEENPEVVRGIAAVFAEFDAAIAERPDAVKAAVARLYPDVDAATMDLLFGAESAAWRAGAISAEGMAQDIAFLAASGIAIPGLDSLDPAALVYVPAP